MQIPSKMLRYLHRRFIDGPRGSGHLASFFGPEEQASYHGVDFSAEALRLARESLPASAHLQQEDIEIWTPSSSYDVIGYFRAPRALSLASPPPSPLTECF